MALADIASGTIWKVREAFWLKALQYDDSDRNFHPGLCLRGRKTTNYLEPIPMLKGGSRQWFPDDIAVKGVGAGKSEHEFTYFGGDVVPVPVRSFVKPAEDYDPGLLAGDWWEFSEVCPNPDKRRLDRHEMQLAIAWVERNVGE